MSYLECPRCGCYDKYGRPGPGKYCSETSCPCHAKPDPRAESGPFKHGLHHNSAKQCTEAWTHGTLLGECADGLPREAYAEWYARLFASVEAPAPTPEPPRLDEEAALDSLESRYSYAEILQMAANAIKRIPADSGTEGSAERFESESDFILPFQLERSDVYKFAEAYAADLRQRLQDAEREILRLKEEVKIVAGICASDTLPAKEQS